MAQISGTLVRLLVRDGGRCFYCQVDLAVNKFLKDQITSDHVIPRFWGGQHKLENQVVCCKACHRIKCVLEDRAFRLCGGKVENLYQLCEAFWAAACAHTTYPIARGPDSQKIFRPSRNRAARLIYAVWPLLEKDGPFIQRRLDERQGRKPKALVATVQQSCAAAASATVRQGHTAVVTATVSVSETPDPESAQPGPVG